MLMIDSAVKLGAQGSIDYSTDDNFRFNTYKQQFKYLRKQFNTNPHHKDEQSMGTQMVKVALSSLVMGNTYTKEDGQELTYLFATYTTGGGIFYTIYAEGSAEEIETLFPPVIENILWTFHIGSLSGY